MSWKTVAEGTNIWDLESTVGDLKLPPGSEMQVVLNLTAPLGWAFNVAGIEHVFRPFVPNNMELIDVSGRGSQAFIDMKVAGNPVRDVTGRISASVSVWPVVLLTGALAFIRTHWLSITIAGFVLTAIIASVIILVKIAVAPALPVAMLAIAGGLLIGGILLARQLPARRDTS